MQEPAYQILASWSSFFVIAGSAGASLTGLMFVVITLVAGRRSQTPHEGISTFSTPTVVHFCAALLVSAILSAPWHSLGHAGVVLGIAGVAGIVYVLRVLLQAKRQTIYQPLPEDWLWYTILPCVAYAAIVAGGIMLGRVPPAMFTLASGTLLLIFCGIHNAWDVVTYIAIDYVDEPPSASSGDGTSSPPAEARG